MINSTNFEVNDLHKVNDTEVTGSDRIPVANKPKAPDRPISSITLDQVRNYANGGAKKLVALLNQTDSNPPTMVILENTFGVTPTFDTNGTGSYNLHIPGLDPTKTVAFIGNITNNGPQFPASAAILGVFNGDVTIVTQDGVNPADGELLNTPIEVRQYL